MIASACSRFSSGLSCYIGQSSVRLMVLAGSLMPFAVQGAEMPDNLQLHGFASQGLISTTHNNFFGPSENSVSSEFTELGVNVSYRPNPDLQLSAQALSRRAGETDKGNVRLDYGFLGYTPVSSNNWQIGGLVGKVKNPLGFYNETRDIAFTRPSILLPQSIYFDRTRNFGLSATGIQLFAEHTDDAGLLSFRVSIGKPDLGDKSMEYALLGGDRPGHVSGTTSYLGRLMYEWGGERLRLAVTRAQVNTKYEPGTPDPFLAGTFTFSPWVLSAQYNTEQLSFTSEYALREGTFKGFGPLIPDVTSQGESAYVQMAYRFAPKWDGLVRYDLLYQDRRDRSGERTAAVTGKPAYSYYAKDWTIGLRRDITSSFMVSGEFHSINGTGWLPFEDNLGPGPTKRRWNMFLLQASYRF